MSSMCNDKSPIDQPESGESPQSFWMLSFDQEKKLLVHNSAVVFGLASTQFENKFIAASIPALKQKHNLKIKWNHFATLHGKGPVDRISGSTTLFVWDNVSPGKK